MVARVVAASFDMAGGIRGGKRRVSGPRSARVMRETAAGPTPEQVSGLLEGIG